MVANKSNPAHAGRLFGILLALALTVPQKLEAATSLVIGAGMETCQTYVNLIAQDQQLKVLSILSWVQGYFSARNMAVPGSQVGGGISVSTLQSMLADQCDDRDLRAHPVAAATQRLYDKLKSKSL